MLSHIGRSFARALPRSLARPAPKLARLPTSSLRCTARAQPSILSGARTASAPFSSTSRSLQGSEELVAKLEAEIGIEEDAKKDDAAKETRDFFQDVWQLDEQPGSQDIKLSRTYNDEHIEVILSVTPASALDQGIESSEDQAYEDEEFEEPSSNVQSGGANTKGASAQGQTPEGNVRVAQSNRSTSADETSAARDEEYAEDEGDEAPSYPVQMTVRLTRDGKSGVLEIDAEAAAGYLEITHAAFWPTKDFASATAEVEQQKNTLYGGPSFTTLDPDLQTLLMQFLEERGIDLEMILRLPDLVEWKEEKEYLNWLRGVKDFLA